MTLILILVIFALLVSLLYMITRSQEERKAKERAQLEVKLLKKNIRHATFYGNSKPVVGDEAPNSLFGM